MGVPGTYVSWPSVLVIARSTCVAPRLSVSEAVLLPGVGSIEPGPAVTVAWLTSGPLAPELIVPLTVRVSAWPAPGASVAPVKLTPLPAEALMPQLSVAVAVQVAVTPVMAGGTGSLTATPVAVLGPALVTVMV